MKKGKKNKPLKKANPAKRRQRKKSIRIVHQLKEQAALEFLMTYAWAILVVLVSIGALAYFGVLSPDKFLPSRCTLPSGITCLDSAVENDPVTGNGRITLRVQNSLGNDIVGITVAAASCGSTTWPSLGNGNAATITINCAGPLTSSKYNNQINFSYANLDTGVTHNFQGTLINKVTDATSGSQSGGGDTTPPVLSNGQPTGQLASGTTSAIMNVTTNENSNCRYSTTAGIPYSSMTNTFSTTGSTLHYTSITGLSDGGNYTRYIRCQDTSPNLNANTNDYLINFSVAAFVDVTPPTVSLTAPLAVSNLSGTIDVNATASDNIAVAGVQFKLDSNNLGLEDTTSPYSISWDTTTATNGAHTISATARDAAGNTANSVNVTVTVSNFVDTTPPVLSNGTPTGILPAGTTQTTMSATTNENANCRYSTISNTAYSSMPNNFTTTGSTSHSTIITGLSNGTNYTYYLRCQDTAGNANTVDSLIMFSVATPSDTTPPTATITAPTNNSVLAAGTTQTTLSATTNEAATCRWSTTDQTYALMTNTFTTTGSTSHSTTISGLSNGQSYTRYIRCQDAAGNANTASVSVSFSVASDTTPPTVTITTPTGGQVFLSGTTQTTLSATTNENANCKWSTIDESYASMPNTMNGGGTTSHTATITGLIDGNSYTRYVRCADTIPNIMTTSQSVNFWVASAGETFITYDTAAGTASGTGNAASLTFSHNLNAGTNRMIVIAIGIENSGAMSVNTVTFGGQPAIRAVNITTGVTGFLAVSELWYVLESNLPADGAQQVVINATGIPSALELNGAAFTLTNVAQTTPSPIATKTQFNTANIATNITPTAAKSWLIDAWTGGNPIVTTANAGQIERRNFADSSSQFAVSTKANVPATTGTMSWMHAAINREAYVIMAVAPAP